MKEVQMKEGIVVINKPGGITSHDVVSRVAPAAAGWTDRWPPATRRVGAAGS